MIAPQILHYLNMSNLDNYYRLFDLFSGKLTEEQKKVLESLEDQLITEEILPAISKSVAPVLSNLRRSLTLVVDYDSNGDITVKTTRDKVVVKENTVKRYEIPTTRKTIQISEANPKEPSAANVPIKRSPATGLCVWLPGGNFIQEKKANLTMSSAVIAAGVERVAALNLPHDGEYLISKAKHPKYFSVQQKLPSGYLLNTHSSTETKKKQLDKISSLLKLGWKVEIIK